MTDAIDDIVSVQISRETTTVSQDSFGIVMIMGTHKVFNDRLKYYSQLTEMVTDGFATTTKEYLAAAKLLAQTPRVETFAIGRRSVDDATVTVSTVAASTDYTVTINGIACTYTSASSGDDATDIGEGLEGAINSASASHSWGLTATNTTGTIAIVSATDDNAWTLSVNSTKLTISTLVASADIADDLTAIQEENSNWYGLVATTRTAGDIEAIAEWVEANKKIFGTASADANILDDSSTTDIAYLLNQANYSRTFVLYHKDAATVYPEAAWFGERFPYLPGKGSWAFKELAGIADSNLTTDQRTNAFAKKANTFESRGGASITMEGWMASGEFIDVMRGLDWLESKIQANIYSRLVNQDVPFTDAGVAIIETELRRSLDLAVTQGVLASSPEYTVTAPLVSTVSADDKAHRNLPAVNFTGTLAGAIHHVSIIGSVSV